MTQDEFIKKYHEYQTWRLDEANEECTKVNRLLEKPHEVVVQKFPNLGYCLMLKTASDFIKELYGGELK